MPKKRAKTETKTEGTETLQAPLMPPGAPLSHIVAGGLPRFNFHARPTSTEESSMTEYPVRESYESLRDNLPGEAGSAWRDADRFTSLLRNTYQNLRDDETLSEEGRHQKAQEAYQRTSARIASSLKKARDKATGEANSAREFSIPMPDGKTLATSSIKDTTELLTVQQETNTIISRVENRRAKLPEGVRVKADFFSDVLRESNREAMERGGVEGAVRAKATLRAGEELGVSADEIVEPYRGQRHYEAADRAMRMELVANAIPSERSIPQPPFKKLGGSPQGVGTYGGGNKAVLPRESAQMFKRQRPTWK
jgi:hypothetical protein